MEKPYIDYFIKTHNWSIDHYKLVYDETINYMTIQMTTPPFLPPVGDVKKLYEFLVLNTKYYGHLCESKFGKFIEYDPFNILPINETIKKYIDKFSRPLPHDVWKIKPCKKCNKYFDSNSYKKLKCCTSTDYCQDCSKDFCHNCNKPALDAYIIRFKTPYENILEYDLYPSSCINDVVEQIADSIDHLPDAHRYIINGRQIDDWSRPFGEYLVEGNNLFHIVLRMRGC
jgi:hypothetical protein